MPDMSDIKTYKTLLQKARTPEEAVMMEQLRAIVHNIPVLYGVLSLAAVIHGLAFISTAPYYLTLLMPLFFISLSIIRLTYWTKNRAANLDPVIARRRLRVLEIITSCVFAAMVSWAWLLLPYADQEHRLYLAFVVSFTGAVGTLCAMPRPRIVALGLSGTFIAFCFMFLGDASPAYYFMAIVLAKCYLVFFLFARLHAQRVRKTIMLYYDLISENERASGLAESNRFLALSDTLTGLPNRRRFFEYITHFFGKCPHGQLPVVGLIDLDGFKPINDVFGHAAGDAVLVETAQRLKNLSSRYSGAVARLGGDEFAYVLPWSTRPEDVNRFAHEVISAISEPFDLQNGDICRVSASIGYSSRRFDVGEAKHLLEQADFALFRAKESNRDMVMEFSSKHAGIKRREIRIQQAFKNADLDKEIYLLFQPVVNSSSGEVSYWEALARWDSPEIGTVSPGEFVPIAEKAGLTQEMTKVIFDKAIRQLREWPENFGVSVNLSAQDVNSPKCIDSLINKLADLPPALCRRVSIEVTESSLLTDFAEVRNNLLRFRELGVQIALDDFGTGFSSLRYLQELEFDTIKIDRSFISSISESEKSFGLVRTISRLCRTLSVACVAEGVETREQLEFVRSAGCTLVQGYFYAKPLSADDVLSYVNGELVFEGYRRANSTKHKSVA